MGLIYSVTYDNASISTATDLFEITVGSRPVAIHMLELGQTSDLGDAAEEVLRIGLYRGVTAGSSGTAETEQKYVDEDAPAATAAVASRFSTPSTGGTLLHTLMWNIRIPTQFIWTPETRPRCSSANDPLSFRLIAAPADAISVSATLLFEEL